MELLREQEINIGREFNKVLRTRRTTDTVLGELILTTYREDFLKAIEKIKKVEEEIRSYEGLEDLYLEEDWWRSKWNQLKEYFSPA